MAEFTLQSLHDEIEADPFALGYKEVGGEWKEDAVIVSLINAKSYKIDKPYVPMTMVRATVTYEAYNTLLGDEQEWLQWMAGGDGDLEVTADAKLQLTGRTLAASGVGGTGTNDDSFWADAHEDEMAPAMLSLIEVDGSRAEVLWGYGKVVSITGT